MIQERIFDGEELLAFACSIVLSEVPKTAWRIVGWISSYGVNKDISSQPLAQQALHPSHGFNSRKTLGVCALDAMDQENPAPDQVVIKPCALVQVRAHHDVGNVSGIRATQGPRTLRSSAGYGSNQHLAQVQHESVPCSRRISSLRFGF